MQRQTLLWALAAALMSSAQVAAAETKTPQNLFLRKHIQVVEAPITATTACAGLPTRSEIARAVLATLERNRAGLKATRTIDIAAPGAKKPLDPSALKVSIGVQVTVGPDPLGKQLAQSVETQLAYWGTPEPVAPLMGAIQTASGPRPCDEALAKSIVANTEKLVQAFANDLAARQNTGSK